MSDDSVNVDGGAMARCDGCGLETRLPGLLKEHRKSFSGRRVKLCGACQVDSLKYAQRTNWALFGIFLAFVVWLGIRTGDAGIVLDFIWIVAAIALCSVLSVLIHELGHALVAKAMGWRVCGMIMGFGRLLWQGRIGDTLLQWRFIQMGGLTMAVPARDGAGVPVQAFVVYLAGPAVNMLAAWLGWSLPTGGGGFNFGGLTFATVWIFFNLFIGVLSLVPYKSSLGGISLGSDGYQMLQAITRPGHLRANYAYGSGVTRGMMLRQLGEVERARLVIQEHLRRYPVDLVGTQLLSAVECELNNYEECAVTARRGLYWLEHDQGAYPPELPMDAELLRKVYVAGLECNLAHAILRGKLGDPAEALELARNAYESIPWMYAVQHTYGYALALNGEVEAGLKLMAGDKAKMREEPEHSQREILETIAEVRSLAVTEDTAKPAETDSAVAG